MKMARNSTLFFILVAVTACSVPRTRNTDPVLRVAIDADSMTYAAYMRLQTALMRTGKFIVVDRAAGFKAIAKEQERQHTTTRFGSNEKYALWGKMYGIGGIFVASQQCRLLAGFFGKPYHNCIESLSLINATTGEVMAASENTQDSDFDANPEWEVTVNTLIETYPKVFVDNHDLNRTITYDSTLTEYREKTVLENRKPEPEMKPEDSLNHIPSQPH